MRKENINFKASVTAPNPKEVVYWIDLKEGPNGEVIKTYADGQWIKVNEADTSGSDASLASLTGRVTNLENNKLDTSTYNAFVAEVNDVHNDLEDSKADKSATLAGYGITDAYTKTETNNQIDTKVAALVNQAPETMNTLDELAAALGDDPNFATTIANQIGTKANSADVYTKSDIDGKGFATTTQLNSKVSGTGVTNMQVVTELPESPDANTLYIITAA